MSRGTGRYSFDDVTSVGGRTRLPWSDDRTASEDPSRQTRARQSDVYAVPRPRAGETSRIDVSSFAPERDASDAQRTPAVTPPVAEQQPAASSSPEEYPFARPQQLGGVVGLVAAGLGLLAAAILGHQLMTTAPVTGVAAAQPPAPIAPPPPPPVLMSIAPEPPSAALPADAGPRVVAPPAPSPMAAAAPQRRVHAVAKPRPPIVRPSAPESPATAELDSLAVPAEATAAPEAPPEEEADPGTLRINSLPWAQVFLDGQLIGNTPLRGVRVAAGEHSLRFVNHQFSMVKTSEISVPAGEELTIVERLDE
ncbi:MAG TPA: PEGA domain-containing protein [Polyangiales bacterium]|nr:PEGA domain-containing protein [Polyangiales bacterium]